MIAASPLRQAPRLAAQGIVKAFDRTTALQGVSVALHGGEAHALMGENGAGKSTLSRILAGMTRPDRGRVLFDGREVALTGPLDAQRRGVAMIHQELDLFPHLGIGENMVIANLHFPQGRFVDPGAIERFCRPFLDRVGLDEAAGRMLGTLPIGRQQLVAIARVLSMGCDVLLMDEPTSALSEDSAERLFGLIASLKAQGAAIVYVSHKMDEVLRVCDRVTVMRDGRVAGTHAAAELDRDLLVRLMVDRPVEARRAAAPQAAGEVVLAARDLTTRKLRSLSFALRRGEVLGVAGLVGSGRSELGAALVGLDRPLAGELLLDGARFAPADPGEALRRGVALLPEDRRHQGLMGKMNVRENATIAVLPAMAPGGITRPAVERRAVEPLRGRLSLKCASLEAPITSLSGGNQQKALLARLLLAKPRVLFLDDPTRGIDVGAKEDIYRMIADLAAGGAAILLASSELAELLRCCSRIIVLNDGRIAGTHLAAETSQEAIIADASGSLAEAA